MKYLLLALTGAISGILGGMGMGGGTLLIPALTILFKLNQRLSQTINLVAFIPMAIVALIIHSKNKMIMWKEIILIVVCALATSVIGSLIAKGIKGDLQTKLFGAFLLALSIFQTIMIKTSKPQKKNTKK